MSGTVATERLYYTDAYLPEFGARVVDRSDDGLRVYLDRTAFYPTSGGQPHDTGVLASSNVVDVIDEGDRIAHVIDAPVHADEVRGKVYWSRRFDNMQQHTGQHLLSAIFEDLFKARTVSVHFGDETSTVDIETDSLSSQSLEKAEKQANLIVAENRPVSVSFEDAATAKGLRKAVDRQGTLRIITIADLDRSACGGTHVRSTGEIGSILLRGTERVRKAMRVEFACGLRGVARARADYQALSVIASTLSTSLDAAAALVTSQAAQLKQSEKEKRNLERQNATYQARSIYETTSPGTDGVRIVSVPTEAHPLETLRTIGMALMEMPKAAFAAVTPDGHLIVTTSEDSGRDAGKAIRVALDTFSGKGGGSPRLAQGAVPKEKASEAYQLIRAVLERGQ